MSKLEDHVRRDLTRLAVDKVQVGIEDVMQLVDDPHDRVKVATGIATYVMGFLGATIATSHAADTGKIVSETEGMIAAAGFLLTRVIMPAMGPEKIAEILKTKL